MAKSYKVTVFAGTKVVADMAKQVRNDTIEASIQLKTVKGGSTSATPTILKPGPTGANRKMEDVEGWFVNGTSEEPPIATGTPWEAPRGSKNTNWWDGTAKSWSLGSSVPYPKGDNGKTIEIFDATKVGGYVSGSQIFYNHFVYGLGIYQVKSGQTATTGQSPESNPDKFDFINLNDASKVAKRNVNIRNLFNGDTISGNYIDGANAPIPAANSETTVWVAIEELTTYIATNTGNAAYGDVLWADINQNVLSRGTGLTTTGATSPKGARWCMFTVTYKNAAIVGKQGQYVVLSVKANRPLIYFKQNPANVSEDYNPISGYVDFDKAPFNRLALKKRTNLFNYKTVNKGMYVDASGNIITQAATGTNTTFGNGRMSAPIPVKGNTYYTRSGPLARGIAFYDQNGNVLSVDFTQSTVTILSPANAAIAIVNVQEYNVPVTDESVYRYFQFQEGQIATPYKEYEDLDIETSKAIEVFNPSKPSGYYSGNQIVYNEVIYQVKTGQVAATGQSPETNPEKFDVILRGKTLELYNAAKVGGYTAGSQIVFDNSIYQVKAGQTATTGQSPLTNPEKFTEIMDSVTIEKFNPTKPIGYLAGSQIIFNDILYQVKTGQIATTGQSPATNPEKFDVLFKDTTVIIDEIKDTDLNAVNSVAVNKKLNATSLKIVDDLTSFTMVDGMAYKNNSDALVSDSNYAYYFKAVQEGDIYDVEGYSDANVSQAVLFKSDTFVSGNRVAYLGFRASHNSTDLLKNRLTITQDGWLLIQRRKSPTTFTIKKVSVDKYIPVKENDGLAPEKYMSNNSIFAVALRRNLLEGWQDVTNIATLNRDAYVNNTGTPLSGQSFLNYYVIPAKKGDKIKFIGFAYQANTSETVPFPVILNTDRLDSNAVVLASNTEGSAVRDESKIKTYIVTVEKDGFIKVNVRYYHFGPFPFYIFRKNFKATKIYATPDDITNVGNVKFPFNNSVVFNDWEKDIFAHASHIFNYNKGRVGEILNIYFCSETSYTETLDGALFCKFSVANVKDFRKKTFYTVLQTGMQVGSFKQRAGNLGGIGVVDAFVFQPDSGEVLCVFVCDNENDSLGVRMGGRYFNMSTKAFENQINQVNIIYNGDSRNFTINNFVDIVQTETGYTDLTKKYTIMTGYFPKYGSYYYTCVGTLTNSSNDGYTGSILRTQDGLNWEYVKTLPGTNRAAWELAPEIIGDNLYISVRDVGQSTSTMLYRYNIVSGIFDVQNTLPFAVSTKTHWFKKYGKLYLVRNVTPNYVNNNGTNIARSRIEISVIDQNTLQQLDRQEILTEFGCHYPSIAEKGGNHYMVYTEDRALYNPVSPKQNICIIKLDDYLKI